jgi:uncharacterized membrane protein
MDPILPTTAVPPPPPAPAPQPQPEGQRPKGTTSATIVYVLYLASLLVGITALVGLVMAYVNVGDAPEPLKSHYRFQIRTFWIGLLYGLVGLVLALAVIGAFVFLFVAVWLIVRCVKGLKALDRGAAYPNVETWLW